MSRLNNAITKVYTLNVFKLHFLANFNKHQKKIF